jgi:uncharacterized protein (TIGR02301 family)
MRRILTALLIAASASGAAFAQDRAPAGRQALVDLAYVLGESHALRQACRGEEDQFWRMRMIDLQEAERPDDSLGRRLRAAFNTGYSTARATHPDCTPDGRAAQAQAAIEGRRLALRLSAAAVGDEAPDAMADVASPR